PVPQDVSARSQRAAADAAAAPPGAVFAREDVPAALVVGLRDRPVGDDGPVSAPQELLVDEDVAAPVGVARAGGRAPARDDARAAVAGGRRRRAADRAGRSL